MQMRSMSLLLAVLAAFTLAACGGGSDPVPNVGDIPAAAVETPTAYATYVGDLAPDDTAEPLSVEGVMPPTSETDEPAPLR